MRSMVRLGWGTSSSLFPVEADNNIDAIIERQKMAVDQLVSESLFRVNYENFKPVTRMSELAS